MSETKLAVMLYNVREHCQNESDLDRTLDEICKIGYTAVQASLSTIGVDAPTLKKQLDSHGLICCASSDSLDNFSNNIPLVLERLNILNCKYTSLPWADIHFWRSLEDQDVLVNTLNSAARELLTHGINLAYHNHDFEFFRLPNQRKNMLELFYEKTDHDAVSAMLDVHWVTRGGSNPVTWINKLAGRIKTIHFKDFLIDADRKPQFCEIGEGNLDWAGIIKACNEAKIEWYIVEQDNPSPVRDIFESIKISYDYLSSFGLK